LRKLYAAAAGVLLVNPKVLKVFCATAGTTVASNNPTKTKILNIHFFIKKYFVTFKKFLIDMLLKN
jgi:hypothetical protein